jgi:murein DD-endopeptidase MepM/ murein hydrolase activator NlpD
MLAIIATCLIVLPGPVTEPFAPEGPYAGHWGIDVEVPAAAVVVAPLDGVVTFAGEVAGVKSVTIRDRRFRVSLSYLDRVDAKVGQFVRRGDAVGRAGTPHGVPGLHIGLRDGNEYVDPVLYSRCRGEGTLRLLPPPMLTGLASKE